MLENIGECDETALECIDCANVLDCRAILFTSKDFGEPLVLPLPISDIIDRTIATLLPEGETAGGDVFRRVIVYCCSADMLVLEKYD